MGGVISPTPLEDAVERSVESDNALLLGVRKELEVMGPGGGSMSSEDKNDVDSRSCIVLVIVRNVSSTWFCSVRGVPLRSRTLKGRSVI